MNDLCMSCVYVCVIFFNYVRAVYTNRDGLTGFGTPWEILFQNNYTILTKGGNVQGFSASFSFVPDLQLSKYSSW